MEEFYLNQTAMPVTCLFRTQSALEIVRQHCLKKLILQSPDLRKFFLRFYDPRVLVHLLYLFDAEQLAGIFMGLQAYSFFLDGAWHTVTAPQVSVDLAKYRVSQNQLEKIQRIQTMNRVLDQLSDRPRYTTIHAEVYRRYCENIDQLVVRAEQQLGLTLQEDQALFACHALTIHPAFDQHPKIKTLLSQRNSQEQSYTDMAALLSESDWQQIRQECKHGSSNSALIN
jgi:hypothetical protein